MAMALAMTWSCGATHSRDWDGTVTAIKVALTSGNVGYPDQPLDYSTQGIQVIVDLAMRSAGAGDGVAPFNGWVRLSSRPGTAFVTSGTGVFGNDVYVSNGVATGIGLTVVNGFGQTRIWAEDVGYEVAPPGAVPACADGADNDGDGDRDYPGDSGCLDASDNSEAGGSAATGVSDPIYIDYPTLAELQGRTKESPFVGESVTVTHGDMVVTRITSDGMYLTDIADPGTFNHLFLFNFNTPEGVRVCDRVTSVTGIVSEFYGFTELGFPSWNLDWWHSDRGPCPVPEPHVLTAEELVNAGTAEGFEAALVRVTDVTVGDNVVNCDHNGDGTVDFKNYNTGVCSSECECRAACEADPLCTEMVQYHDYFQWAVRVGGPTGAKLWVVSRDNIPDFDPFAEGHSKTIASITGTLRNMSFLRPQWILEPRCPADLVVSGTPPAIAGTCVFPRTGEEDEPN